MKLNTVLSPLCLSIGMAFLLMGCGGGSKDNSQAVVPPPVVEDEKPTPEEPVHIAGDFRITPYLQNPASDAMTIMWFSGSNTPGELVIDGVGTFKSAPVQANELGYSESEVKYIHDKSKNLGLIHTDVKENQAPTLPFQHQIRVDNLKANQTYSYKVNQAGNLFEAEFKTAPTVGSANAVKFVVMSDMETEPESTGKVVKWAASAIKINGWKLDTDSTSQSRDYLIDQTTGYKQTLNYALKSSPNFWLIAGDLVEKGGRQLDWDEFWRHSAGQWGTLASRTPILPALGNHENYWQPSGAAYGPGAVKRSYDKWRTYFDVPSNNALNKEYNERYYRVDYGPVTVISLDSSNGNDADPSKDTNLAIDGVASNVPDFNYGTEQWQWAVNQLADARSRGQIIFVQWHHMAYGTGVHSLKSGSAGIGKNEDSQSGLPMRIYHDLMKEYGVTAVFSGHNELLETVELDGVHYWDVGIAGDGLRGPGYYPTTTYVPFDLLPEQAQKTHWSAHGDSQEWWVGKQLVEGGKHYGFLEVEVNPQPANQAFEVVIRPRYSVPVMDENGQFTVQFNERVYNKIIRINKKI